MAVITEVVTLILPRRTSHTGTFAINQHQSVHTFSTLLLRRTAHTILHTTHTNPILLIVSQRTVLHTALIPQPKPIHTSTTNRRRVAALAVLI